VPIGKGDPQAQPASYAYTSGNTVVDQNASELWTVLVCKPWLDGELGTSNYAAPGGKPTVVNTYGRQLLWAQTIAANERPTTALIQAKQATYAGIATSIEHANPAIYPLFQGKEWTTRMEIAFAALFAAVVAGVLILLISVTLILLKLGFLLLLIVGPFFLLVGTHPGFGRVVALRWVEMLIGVLLKQAAVALVLSVLLYCYALIMGTSDAVLPWALKILMIALVTLAAFIYRKPFQHLFSAVGYGVIGSRDRADADLARAGSTFRGNTRSAATLAVPGFAAYRAARWARQNPAQAAGLAMSATTAAGVVGMAAGKVAGGGDGSGTELADGAGADEQAAAAASGEATARAAAGSRGRAWAAAGQEDGPGRQAPPLNLPSRNGSAAPARSATDTGPVPASRKAPDLPVTGSGQSGGGGWWQGRSATRQDAAAPSSGRQSAPRQSVPPQSGSPQPGSPQSGSRQSAAPRVTPPRQSGAPRQAPPPRQGQPPRRSGRPAPRSGQSGAGSGGQQAPSSTRQPPPPPGPFWLRPFKRDR
jgi:hypothetical protein